jgi:hypothetical protein
VLARRREASPKRISLERHSVLTDRTQRSAKAFKFGLRAWQQNWFYATGSEGHPKRRTEFRIAIMQCKANRPKNSINFVCGVAGHLDHP